MSDPSNADSPFERGGDPAGSGTISLLDLVAVVVKRRWLIIGITAFAAALVLLLLVLSMRLPAGSRLNFFPDTYRPTASILLQAPSQSSSLSSLLQSSGLGSLGSLLGTSSGGNTNADLIVALLKSNSVLDQAVTEFDIPSRLAATTHPKASARLYVSNSLWTKVDTASGIMQIGFSSTDREFATRIVNYLVSIVGSEFTRLSVSKILEKERYLGDQLAAAQTEATRLQAKLSAFQSEHGIYNIDQQASANIQTVAALQSRIISMQIDLASQSRYLPDTDYRIVQLKDTIRQTQNEVDALTKGSGGSGGAVVSQSTLLSLSGQYQALLRDVTVQQAIVSTIQGQYQAARIDELARQQAFQVVDPAEVPEIRSGPQRAKTAVLVTAVAGVASVLLAFFVEYVDRARRDPAQARIFREMRDSLIPRRRRQSPR